MLKYILRRLLLMIPILLGVSFIIFGIMHLTPGEPAQILLGDAATTEQVAALTKELGYDRPFLEQYFTYIKDIITKFDFGNSFRTGIPVTQEIVDRSAISIRTSILAMIGASLIGIPIGILSAVKQHSLLDTMPTFLALILASLPAFWLGMILLYIFALRLGWLPAGGVDTIAHYVLPVFTLSLPHGAVILRYTRSSMLEIIRADYIRTARAKGASEKKVIWKHALKNALLPVITVMGISFASVLGNAVSVETLFSIPGLGRTLVEAVRMKDLPLVMGLTLFLSLANAFIVLTVDILYAFIDPRIKAKYQSN